MCFIDSTEWRSKTIFGKNEIVLLDFIPFLNARAGRIPDGMQRLWSRLWCNSRSRGDSPGGGVGVRTWFWFINNLQRSYSSSKYGFFTTSLFIRSRWCQSTRRGWLCWSTGRFRSCRSVSQWCRSGSSWKRVRVLTLPVKLFRQDGELVVGSRGI